MITGAFDRDAHAIGAIGRFDFYRDTDIGALEDQIAGPQYRLLARVFKPNPADAHRKFALGESTDRLLKGRCATGRQREPEFRPDARLAGLGI